GHTIARANNAKYSSSPRSDQFPSSVAGPPPKKESPQRVLARRSRHATNLRSDASTSTTWRDRGRRPRRDWALSRGNSNPLNFSPHLEFLVATGHYVGQSKNSGFFPRIWSFQSVH